MFFDLILTIILSSPIIALITCNWKFNNQFRIVRKAPQVTFEDFLLLSKRGGEKYYLKRKSKIEGKEEYIENIITDKILNKNDVLICGAQDSGKTRMAFEVIKGLDWNYNILIPTPDQPIKISDLSLKLFFPSIFKTKYIILLDDLDRFKESWIASVASKIGSKREVVILATLKDGQQFDDFRRSNLFRESRFSDLISNDHKIVIPPVTEDEAKEISKNIKCENPSDFFDVPNLTIGMIVSDLSDLKSQFNVVSTNHPIAERLTELNLMLYNLGLSRTNYNRINEISLVIDGEEFSKRNFNEAEKILRKNNIIGWNQDGFWYSGGKILTSLLAKDDLITLNSEEVITIFSNHKDYMACYEIGLSLLFKEELKEACFAYEKVVQIRPEMYQAWNNWGAALFYLGFFESHNNFEEGRRLFESAIDKFKEVIKLSSDKYLACNNWATALYLIGYIEYSQNPLNSRILFNNAFTKYEKLVNIEPNMSDAWYNWGTGLTKFAELELTENPEEARRLLIESCEKYKETVKIKPDMNEAWYNWAINLGKLAELEPAENLKEVRRLLSESCKKYESVTKIKKEDEAAWGYWATELGKLASIWYTEDQEESRKLFYESFEKYEMSTKIKPEKNEAWMNWGYVQGYFGHLEYPKNRDEGRRLFNEGFEIFEKALEKGHEMHKSLVFWGDALGDLAYLEYPEDHEKGRRLYEDAFKKYKAALTIKPDMCKALKSWGNDLKDFEDVVDPTDIRSKETIEKERIGFTEYKELLMETPILNSEPDISSSYRKMVFLGF